VRGEFVSSWNATFNIITSPANRDLQKNDATIRIQFYFSLRCITFTKVINKSNFQLKTILYFLNDSLSKFCMFYRLNNGHDFVLYFGVGWVKNIWKVTRESVWQTQFLATVSSWSMEFDIFPIRHRVLPTHSWQ